MYSPGLLSMWDAYIVMYRNCNVMYRNWITASKLCLPAMDSTLVNLTIMCLWLIHILYTVGKLKSFLLPNKVIWSKDPDFCFIYGVLQCTILWSRRNLHSQEILQLLSIGPPSQTFLKSILGLKSENGL